MNIKANNDNIVMLEENKENDDSDFFEEAIMSIDKKINSLEKSQDYIKYFFNSSMVVTTESIDLFRPSTILVMLINLINFIFEIFGLIFTFLLYIIYNVTATNFIPDVLTNIFELLEKILFNWSDPNSYIYKLIILSCFFGLIARLIKQIAHLNFKSILNIIMSSVVTGVIIIFIGQYGRTIINYSENLMTESIASTLIFEDNENSYLPLEIQQKVYIFDLMQKQPFILRHFGTLDLNKIDNDEELAKRRIEELLKNPTENNAEIEVKDFNNKFISDDITTSMKVLTVSVILIIHRILLFFVIVPLCCILGIIKISKELLLFFAIFQLILLLFKSNNINAIKWFSSRLQWIVLSMVANVLFTVALYFIIKSCVYITSMHILLLIGFDILLILLIKLAWDNKEKIFDFFKEASTGFFESVIINGQTPINFVNSSLKKIDNDDCQLEENINDIDDLTIPTNDEEYDKDNLSVNGTSESHDNNVDGINSDNDMVSDNDIIIDNDDNSNNGIIVDNNDNCDSDIIIDNDDNSDNGIIVDNDDNSDNDIPINNDDNSDNDIPINNDDNSDNDIPIDNDDNSDNGITVDNDDNSILNEELDNKCEDKKLKDTDDIEDNEKLINEYNYEEETATSIEINLDDIDMIF